MKVVYNDYARASTIFLYIKRARGVRRFSFDFSPVAEYDENMKDFDVEKLRELPHFVTFSHVEETASTSDDLKAVAREGAADYTLRVADRQLAGRGRVGRSFYSENGLYMSVLLPAKEETFPYVTPIAAVAVARAIRELTGEPALIKWVNDVFVNGKKVCGILTESVETSGRRRLVVGIGINIDTPQEEFPEDIRETAGSIHADRSALAARILTHLFSLLDEGDLDAIRSEYRALSFLIGREITVQKENGCLKATAIGLTNDLALSVRYEDGNTEDLRTGEVGVRLFF